ncbi:hypothetical protein BANRA_00793 [Klebsiella pneumoniae]|nr:hypothetical protein BANRA_00793 [Klebsiella pneumoniae]
MIKGIKIFITVVFVILALLSGMMSFMIVGMGSAVVAVVRSVLIIWILQNSLVLYSGYWLS